MNRKKRRNRKNRMGAFSETLRPLGRKFDTALNPAYDCPFFIFDSPGNLPITCASNQVEGGK